jgi:hypothetical protein
MTWTYTADPGSNVRDEVRFLLGDTDSTDQQVSDEEILWTLDETPNTYIAAALCLEALASKVSGRATNRAIGSLSISYLNRAQELLSRAKALRARASLKVARPYVGGTSKMEKEVNRQNEDLVQPAIRKDMHTNVGEDVTGRTRVV